MGYDTAQPYIASYIIVRKGSKIAFLLRSNTDWMNNWYSLPSGKVEKDESYTQAAIREAKEEIGILLRPENLKQILTVHRYEPSSHAAHWVDIFFEASEWEGEPYNAEPKVHSKLDWLDPDNLPDQVITSVKFAIQKIQAGEHYAEYGY